MRGDESCCSRWDEDIPLTSQTFIALAPTIHPHLNILTHFLLLRVSDHLTISTAAMTPLYPNRKPNTGYRIRTRERTSAVIHRSDSKRRRQFNRCLRPVQVLLSSQFHARTLDRWTECVVKGPCYSFWLLCTYIRRATPKSRNVEASHFTSLDDRRCDSSTLDFRFPMTAGTHQILETNE